MSDLGLPRPAQPRRSPGRALGILARVPEDTRRRAQAVLAGAFVAVALLSVLRFLPGTIDALGRERQAGAALTPAAQAAAPLLHSGLPAGTLAFLRANVHPADRVLLVTAAPAGSTRAARASAIRQRDRVRLAAGYALLPAVLVTRPSRATQVLAVGVPASAAGLPLRPAHRLGPVILAGVRRGA
jgi:hypothetical protein